MKKLLARAGYSPPSASCPSGCDMPCKTQHSALRVAAARTRGNCIRMRLAGGFCSFVQAPRIGSKGLMAGFTCHNQLNQPCKEKNVEWVYIVKYLHQKNDPKSTILFTQVHKSMLIRLQAAVLLTSSTLPDIWLPPPGRFLPKIPLSKQHPARTAAALHKAVVSIKLLMEDTQCNESDKTQSQEGLSGPMIICDVILFASGAKLDIG